MKINNDTISTILDQVKELAVNEFIGKKKEISDDTKKFIETTKAKLEEWTDELIAGDIDEGQFKHLVRNQKNLFEMKAITNAGIAAVAIDNLRQGVLNIIVNVLVSKVF